MEIRCPVSVLGNNACHPERSEGSLPSEIQILRFSQSLERSEGMTGIISIGKTGENIASHLFFGGGGKFVIEQAGVELGDQ